MLPLDSPRWSELDVFYGSAAHTPSLIAEWIAAIGFDQEWEFYAQHLAQIYLHQGTTTNIAYAVVPWIVAHCPKADIDNRVVYIMDVAAVEQNRLTGGVYYVRDNGDREPAWLMEDYQAALVIAQELAEDLLDQDLPEEERRQLWRLQPALHGNLDLLKERESR